MHKERNFILGTAILCTIAMLLVDGLLSPPYFLKSIIKMVLYGGCVLLYTTVYKERPELFHMPKGAWIRTVLLSAGVFLLIVSGYFLTRTFVDYSNITGTLTSTIGVSKDNFLYVSLYISFVNSLLEEIFFRGYCYLTLRKHMGHGYSFVFSALLFSFYHVGLLNGWFHIAVYLLMLTGLFLAGLFFNLLDHKADSILPSWLPHMFANFGINTVGMLLFGILY